MEKEHIVKLHWKLFFPLIALLWLIIGISMTYSVIHEKKRVEQNLENRLLNINATVLSAYGHGADLQRTVNFIRLFTDSTTLEPLRLTVYDDSGKMLADNPEPAIRLTDDSGRHIDAVRDTNRHGGATVRHMILDGSRCMVSAMTSADGRVHTYAALPYKGAVLDFLSTDRMVWLVILGLGLLSSVLAYVGLRTVCQDVYNLRDFARAMSADGDDTLPDISSLHFTEDELGEVSRDLLTIYRDKIRAVREKTIHEQLISLNLTHELNTPVGVIKGYLDTLLADDAMSATLRRKFLRHAQQSADRLAELIADIREITRLETDGPDMAAASETDFHLLAEKLRADVRSRHLADGLDFTVRVPDRCMVRANEAMLSAALLHLVRNAAIHSGGTAITLQWLRCDGHSQHFSFTDNGRGVPPEHLGRLFDLFYRADSGRARKNGGAGLGLAIVRRTFEALGGHIQAAVGPAGGLEFTFTLPAAAPPPQPAAQASHK